MDNKKIQNKIPSQHVISYPEKIAKRSAESGASSFQGKLDHKDSRYYVFNDYYNMESDESLSIITHYNTYQQTTEYTCGAACALMVLYHFGKKAYNEDVLGILMESMPDVGTSVENIADFFDLIGWNVLFHADTDIFLDEEEDFEQFVIDFISQGIPIMVDWMDWSGHWATIIGIDTCGTDIPYDDVLIFADPYDVTSHYQDGYNIFSLVRFYEMWKEGNCTGKTEPYQQPFVIAYPKDMDIDKEIIEKYKNFFMKKTDNSLDDI